MLNLGYIYRWRRHWPYQERGRASAATVSALPM